MTVLDDLKKIRRTRWSRLNWPIDCPMLASRLAETSNAEDGRAALSEALAAVEAYLVSEGNLIRYSHCARAVLSALLGLGDTAERGADERYETASRIASVPVATLKTRDGNLLLDAFARALTVEWQLAAFDVTADGHAQPSTSRGRYLESLVRKALLELAPEHGEAAWLQGCQPILAIDRDPRRLRREVSYTAGIEYRRLGPSYCYQVTSSFRSVRALPSNETVDVAFCRSTAALEREYRRPTTISVELCEFDPEAWEQWATHEIATDLQIGSFRRPVIEVVRDGDVTRLRFDVPDMEPAALRVPVSIKNTYLVPASSRVYPIRLGDYFTAGPCEMSVTLIDPRAESLDAFVYFSAAGSRSPDDTSSRVAEVERFLTPEGARQQTVRVRSPREALIWPYSGADFVWRRR